MNPYRNQWAKSLVLMEPNNNDAQKCNDYSIKKRLPNNLTIVLKNND